MKLRGVFILLFVYLLTSVFSYFPHYLSYFNELVWDRKNAYKVLTDPTMDWGQNRWYLGKYKRENPEVIIHPRSPVAGRIVVSVGELAGRSGLEKYRWLRENFEPVDHVAYSYLVYDIRPEDLERF